MNGIEGQTNGYHQTYGDRAHAIAKAYGVPFQFPFTPVPRVATEQGEIFKSDTGFYALASSSILPPEILNNAEFNIPVKISDLSTSTKEGNLANGTIGHAISVLPFKFSDHLVYMPAIKAPIQNEDVIMSDSEDVAAPGRSVGRALPREPRKADFQQIYEAKKFGMKLGQSKPTTAGGRVKLASLKTTKTSGLVKKSHKKKVPVDIPIMPSTINLPRKKPIPTKPDGSHIIRTDIKPKESESDIHRCWKCRKFKLKAELVPNKKVCLLCAADD